MSPVLLHPEAPHVGRPLASSRRARQRRGLVAVLAVAVLLVGSPQSVRAQEPGGEAPPPVDTDTDPTTLGDERISPRLWSVAVQGPEYDLAIAEFRSLAYQLDTARASYAAAVGALVELDGQQARLDGQIAVADARARAAEQRIVELQDGVEALAVSAYVSGDPSGGVSDDYDWENNTQRGSRRAFAESVLARHLDDLAIQAGVRDRAHREQAAAQVLAVSVADRIGELTFVRDSSQSSAFLLGVALDEQATRVTEARLSTWVNQTDFQYVALDAYVKAADALALEAPACNLRWEILAGISRTEGRHGTYGGSTLGPDGHVDPPIIGIQLNGSNNTAVVRDTDGGMWDGDAEFDRAVGPMQFIPSTWRAYASDGTGNGEADPQNMYDATLAAGRLLCSRSSALHTEAGLRQGLLAYNVSNEYVRVVSGNIEGYDALELF